MTNVDHRVQHLQRMLGAYPFVDVEGEVHRAMLALSGAGAPSLDAGYFKPGHFTASAFVTDPDRSVMLLIHHRKLQLWLQPGGHVEADDVDVLAAAIREVFEETGIVVSATGPSGGDILDLDIHEIPRRGDTPAHLHYDIRFHLVATGGTPLAGDGVVDARWVPIGDVATYGTDESVLRGVRKVVSGDQA